MSAKFKDEDIVLEVFEAEPFRNIQATAKDENEIFSFKEESFAGQPSQLSDSKEQTADRTLDGAERQLIDVMMAQEQFSFQSPTALDNVDL